MSLDFSATPGPMSHRWSRWRLESPEGWQAVVAVCQTLLDRLDDLVPRITVAIAREVMEFGDPSIVLQSDLVRMSRVTVGAELSGLAELRPAGEDEVRMLRLIGRRACANGVSLRAMIDAYHVGQRELWRAFVDAAKTTNHGARELLLVASDYLMERMIVLTSATVEEYQKASAELDATEAQTAAQFLREVQRDPSSEESRQLARALGFEPELTFRALAIMPSDPSDQSAVPLLDELRRLGCTAVRLERGTTVIVILQMPEDCDVRRPVGKLRSPAGIGMQHQGLPGAKESLLEATAALAVATQRRGLCWYEQDWLTATAVAHRRSFEEVLTPGIRVARAYPHLAQAVRAFAQCRFSVTEAARTLFLSHTGTKSRLVRWVELTGLDVWSHDGLTRSLLACDLADLGQEQSRPQSG